MGIESMSQDPSQMTVDEKIILEAIFERYPTPFETALYKKILQVIQELPKLQDHLKLKSEMIDTMSKEIKKFKDETNKLMNENSEYYKKVQFLEHNNSKLKSDLAVIEEKLHSSWNFTDKLKAENDELITRIDTRIDWLKKYGNNVFDSKYVKDIIQELNTIKDNKHD